MKTNEIFLYEQRIANHTFTQEEKDTRKQTVKQKPSFSLWLQINLNQQNEDDPTCCRLISTFPKI